MAPAAAMAGLPPAGAATALSGAAAGGLGWVEQVRALRSAADVNRLLHEASARERAIDAELEQLLARRGQLEQRLVELHASTEEVGAALHHASCKDVIGGCSRGIAVCSPGCRHCPWRIMQLAKAAHVAIATQPSIVVLPAAPPSADAGGDEGGGGGTGGQHL